mgnify:CR=1 FL=1
MNDVEERFVELADVVKDRRALDGERGRAVETGGVGEREGVDGDPANVCTRLAVGGIDGVEERLERGGGESFGGAPGGSFGGEDGGGEDQRERHVHAHRVRRRGAAPRRLAAGVPGSDGGWAVGPGAVDVQPLVLDRYRLVRRESQPWE